jgi:4-hydroxyacetophenone monooxygenase
MTVLRFDVDPEPITEGDAVLGEAVASAPVASMLAAVAHLTGDLGLLADDLRPDPAHAMRPDGGYEPHQLERAHRLATAALGRWRDAGNPPAVPLSPAGLRAAVEFVAGGPLPEADLPVYLTELAVDGVDRRRPAGGAPGRVMRAAVVGAGMSGIIAAHRLQQAGVEVTVLDKDAGVGGTWFENRYPGCRVDVENHLYAYAEAQTPDWPQHHSTQPVLLDYFEACCDHFSLRERLRLSTEVVQARWDEPASQWELTLRRPGTAPAIERYELLVCATGQLNRPLLPDIDGLGDFCGPSFHSARWDHAVAVDGKRVGVIGTGASAMQFIPELAERAGRLTVFQRTPPWLLPVPHYRQDVGPALRRLRRHLPRFAHWDRLRIFSRTQQGLLPLATVDPAWDGGGRSVSAGNDMLRQMLTAAHDASYADVDLRSKMLPRYPPVAKRIVLDDGTVAATLQRPDVDLVTDAIDHVAAGGVVLSDGTKVPLDVLVLGTGFKASEFLAPMRVVGRDGVSLDQRWAGDARAYLGMTVPGFPNFFMMYGPNTNIVANGSITYFSECQTAYITGCVGLLAAEGSPSLDCRPEVHDAYNAEIDAANLLRAWGVADVPSWYRNRFGRSAQNWPYDLVHYWRLTHEVRPADYVLG